MKKNQAPGETQIEETAPAVEMVPRFTIQQLRESARGIFGISQSTYDAATCALDGDGIYTIEQMREHIDNWLKEVY